MSDQPRLIQTYLLDGTLEGVRIIDCESSVEAYVIPRLKVSEAKAIVELEQPALYMLLNAEDNRVYIGESESFFTRANQHLKGKNWWTLAVAIVSKTNDLEKGDVKYLESLAVERARGGSVTVENSTVPPRNNIHRFKLHKLQKILDDAQLVLTSLGYDVLSVSTQKSEQVWHCRTKLTDAHAVYRGEQFVVLAGSKIDIAHTPSFEKSWPQQVVERQLMFSKIGTNHNDYVELTENAVFKSPNHAGGIVTGSSINAWTLWKNKADQTMDQVMRRGE